MVMGTAMYVSPEQATGAQVTEASDIYSLGVVAFECLAGHPPFTASEPLAIAFAHKHEPVPALPPDVPQPVSDLVYHMLAKTPQERPGSVRLVADRADMLRDALALGEASEPGYPGATRASDLGHRRCQPEIRPVWPRGIRIPRRASRRQLVVVLDRGPCAAAPAGLVLPVTSPAGTAGTSTSAGAALSSSALSRPSRPASPRQYADADAQPDREGLGPGAESAATRSRSRP
jgi:serine/threonine protein kinase